jgi:hypothetical protein
VRIIYDFAVYFNFGGMNRMLLLDSLTPLYFGRVASFVAQTYKLSDRAAEAAVEEQARVYEETKPYLLSRWQQRIGR